MPGPRKLTCSGKTYSEDRRDKSAKIEVSCRSEQVLAAPALKKWSSDALDAHATFKERIALGKKLREKVPRSAHAKWMPPRNRPDPIELLKASDQGRLPALCRSATPGCANRPLPFFAARRPSWPPISLPLRSRGIHVQACGDCHVANFGGFATPERQLVFDINDFDETLPAPWEWDVKRLAASIVLAMRHAGMASAAARTRPEPPLNPTARTCANTPR